MSTLRALILRVTCRNEFEIFGCAKVKDGWLVAGSRNGIGGCSSHNGLRYRRSARCRCSNRF